MEEKTGEEINIRTLKEVVGSIHEIWGRRIFELSLNM